MRPRFNGEIYTGVGSRETPPDVQMQMTYIGRDLGQRGSLLRSGGAPGADTAFEIGAISVDGHMAIYLPWKAFNGNMSPLFKPSQEAYALAQRFHPAWHKLRFSGRSLHARNCHQVLGLDLKTPSKFLICWTPNGDGSGGTGQAIRIAKHYGVPVFDLGIDGELSRLKAFLHI